MAPSGQPAPGLFQIFDWHEAWRIIDAPGAEPPLWRNGLERGAGANRTSGRRSATILMGQLVLAARFPR